MPEGQLTAEDVYDLRKRILDIAQETMNDRAAVAAVYSSFNPELDVRITSIGRLLRTFNAAVLSLTFMHKHLMSTEWWHSHINRSLTDDKMISYTDGYSWFNRAGFAHFTFACIESSFRVMLRAVDPTACDNSMGSFKSIYDCLLTAKLSTCPPEGIEFLDLLRFVRNTVHNNGVYFHRSGRDEIVHWQGDDYEFKQGFPVDFVNWAFCLDIGDASRRLLRTVVEDTNLRAITQEITDPFAQRYR